MNSLRNVLLIGFLYLYCCAAMAHGHTKNQFYAGLKFGALLADRLNAESKNPFGAQLEYHFNQNLAIEIDYLKGDSEYGVPSTKANIESLAAYGVLRSKNTTYFLLKVGLQDDLGTSSILKQEDVSLSVGIGAGLILNSSYSIESEYTIINEDLKYIGLSLRYGF